MLHGIFFDVLMCCLLLGQERLAKEPECTIAEEMSAVCAGTDIWSRSEVDVMCVLNQYFSTKPFLFNYKCCPLI